MIPIRLVWYTKPPMVNTLLDKIVLSTSNWNQGIVVFIIGFAEDAVERNTYGLEVLDYLFGFKNSVQYKKIIRCNPEVMDILQQLNIYDPNRRCLRWNDDTNEIIHIECVKNFEDNVIKYIDGLYENEIILINEQPKEMVDNNLISSNMTR